jgi:hypothetical protein
MTVRCRQCHAELTDFQAPCPGCGVELNDKTVEIIDESGRPTPADFQSPRSDVIYLFLAIAGIGLIGVFCTVGLYFEAVAWEKAGDAPRMRAPFAIAYRIGGPWGIAGLAGAPTLLICAMAVRLGFAIPFAPTETKARTDQPTSAEGS